MKLIELLNSDLDSFKENGYAKAVFLKKDFELPPATSLSEEELLTSLKNCEVKLEDTPNLIANQGWLLLGSTSYLANALKECGIENIDSEFKGFCDFMGW
jgi:hypothetical protein